MRPPDLFAPNRPGAGLFSVVILLKRQIGSIVIPSIRAVCLMSTPFPPFFQKTFRLNLSANIIMVFAFFFRARRTFRVIRHLNALSLLFLCGCLAALRLRSKRSFLPWSSAEALFCAAGLAGDFRYTRNQGAAPSRYSGIFWRAPRRAAGRQGRHFAGARAVFSDRSAFARDHVRMVLDRNLKGEDAPGHVLYGRRRKRPVFFAHVFQLFAGNRHIKFHPAGDVA